SSEALYEEWMDREVRAAVKISDDELRKAYRKFRQERIVEYWTAPEMSEAQKLHKDLLNGKNTDLEPQLKKIQFGKSLETVENAIYDLQEGGITNPILVDSLYYIFKLVKSAPHPEYSKQTFPYWLPTIEKIVRDRKEDIVLDQKFTQMMKDKEFSIKKDAFNFLHLQLFNLIYDKQELKYKEPEQIQRELIKNEVTSASMADRPLVIFKKGNQWTVKDFWQKLSVCPYPMNYKNPDDLKPGLVDLIRRIILFESVTENAAQKQYQNTNYVKSQSAMWSDNLLARALMSSFENKININESDMVKRYDQVKDRNLKPEMRKIIPLYVSSRELAEDLLRQIKGGADFISLAEKYSLNKTGINKTDPGIFINKDYWGEIGKSAFSMQVGKTSDLISVKDTGFAIVKLLEIQSAAPYQYAEVRGKIEGVMKSEVLQQNLNELLSKKAKNYKIKISRTAAEEVEYLNGNMGVKKTHFPLRNLVPMIPLFDSHAQWYKEIANRN
ncbi:MAG: peptidyl-prolyl cis-trans isomerase, partial [Syntrophothermus sp.]